MPSSSGLNSLFASSLRFNKFYNKDKHPNDHQPVSTHLSSTDSTPPPSSSSSSSHRRSFSRSSQIDFPLSIRRSLSLRSSLGGDQSRPRPSTGTHPKLTPSSTFPFLARSSDALVDSSGRGNSLNAMLESSGGLQRSMSYGATALGAPAQIGAGGPQSAQVVYQQIVETATKRISTLDYLRKS
jgi:hypothetical protein